MQSLKKKTDGFTIIEVMIVLVIAAVIILIVFLAVPALQRNSRNNQRRNDASRIAAAVTETANNNNGNLPTDWSVVSPNVGNRAFYVQPTSGADVVSYSGSATSNTDTNTVIIRNGVRCNANGTAVDTGGTAGGRQFVVLYAVETGSGTTGQSQCLGS